MQIGNVPSNEVKPNWQSIVKTKLPNNLGPTKKKGPKKTRNSQEIALCWKLPDKVKKHLKQ